MISWTKLWKTALISTLTQGRLILPRKMHSWKRIKIRWGWGCSSRFSRGKVKKKKLRLSGRGKFRFKGKKGLFRKKGWAQKMSWRKEMKILLCRFSLINLNQLTVRMKALSIQIKKLRHPIKVSQITALPLIRKKRLFLMRSFKN